MTGTKKIQNVHSFSHWEISLKVCVLLPRCWTNKFIKCSLGQNDNSGFNNRQRSGWIQRSSISLSSIPDSGSRGKFLENLLQENWNPSQLHSFSFSRSGAQNRCGALLLHRAGALLPPCGVSLQGSFYTHTCVGMKKKRELLVIVSQNEQADGEPLPFKGMLE